MLRNRFNLHILRLFLCLWIAPIILLVQLGPVMEAAGEPVISPNGDGSETASWDFDVFENYTLSNTTLEGGEVSLTSNGTSYWLQGDDKDFSAGKCMDGAEVVNGDLSLTPPSMINFIENSHFNSSDNWDFRSATNGFVMAGWDGDQNNAWLWHNMTYSGAYPFDSMDDIAATNWSEDLFVAYDEGDFKQNLAPPLVEGLGNLNATITASGPASEYGVERDDPGKWNMTGVGSIIIQIYIESSSGEMVHIQLAGDAMNPLTNWESLNQALQGGWNIYEFDITPFDGSGGGNMRNMVDVLRIHITNIPNFLPRNVYFDDIRLGPEVVIVKPVEMTGYVNQTFTKNWATEDQLGIVVLVFDYTVEEVKDVTFTELRVFIDDFQVWGDLIFGPEPWTTIGWDVSSLMTEKRDYNISLQLLVNADTTSEALCSVRYDNVTVRTMSQENGTFESQVFDAGDVADWKFIAWSGSEPANTSLTISSRMGGTHFDARTGTPDASWSDWMEQSNSSEVVGSHSRFLQFRAVMNVSNTSNIPVLDWVNITYSIYEFELIQTRYEDFENGEFYNSWALQRGAVEMQNAISPTRALIGSGGLGGGVYSIDSFGFKVWDNVSGAINSVSNADFDSDGILDDAVVGANNSNVYLFDENGTQVGLFSGPAGSVNVVSKADVDGDGSFNEAFAGSADNYIYAFDSSGGLIWSNDTGYDIITLSIVDFDGDGYFDDVAAGSGQYVWAYNEMGVLLWQFDALSSVTCIDYADIDSDGIYDEIIVGTSGGDVFGISEGGFKVWDISTKLGDPVTDISNFDIDSDGILDDVVFGDEDGRVYTYSSQDRAIYGHNKLMNKRVNDVSKADLNSDGAFNEIIVALDDNSVYGLNRRCEDLWQNSTGGIVKYVSMADFDGDGFYDDAVAGCDDGFVYAYDEIGIKLWDYNTGGAVSSVTYLEKGTYTYTGNYSYIFDTFHIVQWDTLSWMENIVPGLSDVTFRIRTGNTSTPDGGWSGWTPELSNPAGEDISQWQSRYLQYEINFTRTGGPTLPSVDEIRIKYHRYARNGTIETEDFIGGKVVNWGVFNATAYVPLNTSLSYWFSTDSGGTWLKINLGDDLGTAPIPKIRFRMNLSTDDTARTPVLYGINLTYLIDDMLPLVKVNIPTYGPFNSDPGNIIDVDFDYGGAGNTTLDYAQYKVGAAGPWHDIFTADIDIFVTDWGIDWSELVEGWNTIYLRCYDLAQNVNDTETTAVFRDTIQPEVTINTASYGPFNSDPGNIIDVDFDGLGGSDLDYAEWDTDPGFGSPTAIFTIDTPSYNADWGIAWPELTEGWNTIYIRCFDLAGNINDTQTFTMYKDTQMPEITINLASYGPYNADPGIVIDVDFSSLGGSDLDYAEWDTNVAFGSPTTIFNLDAPFYTADWSIIWSELAQGTNTIYIRCYDVAGNGNDSATITVFKDTIMPDVIVNTGGYGPFNSDPGNIIDVDFDGLGGSDLDYAEWDIDPGFGSPTTIFTSDTSSHNADWGVTWTGLVEGLNTIYIRCYDLAGNVNENEAVTIFKDTVIPAAVTGVIPGGSTQNEIILMWDAVSEGGSGFLNYTIFYGTNPGVDENDATWSYVHQANLTQNSTCYAAITGLTENTTHYFKIIVCDNAGNNGSFADATEISVKTNGLPKILGLDILNHADGESLYAGLTYVWQVIVYDPDDISDLDYVELTPDPLGVGMTLIWTENNDTFWEAWDPMDYVSMEASDSSRTTNTLVLNFTLHIGWEYDSEILNDPGAAVHDGEGASQSVTFTSETWRGENDLEFLGTLVVAGEWQGALASGDWVRGGETITWQGLSVVFEGSVTPPLDSDFDIAVADDGGNLWTDTSGPLDLDTISDSIHDDEDIHNIIVINVPGSSTVPSTLFSIRVDNHAPMVTVNMPSYGPYKIDPGGIIDVDFDLGEDMNSSLALAQYNIGMFNGWVDIFSTATDNYIAPWQLDWDALSSGWNVVYIRCYDAVGNVNDTQQIAFFKGNLPPEAPIPLLPTNNSIEISISPKFSWTEPSDVNGDAIQLYMLEWTTSPDFSMNVESRIVTENYHNLTYPLADPAGYYWRVRAFDGENWGDYSGVSMFYLDSLYYHPRITEEVPDQIKPEDFGFWALNLHDFAVDMNTPQSQLKWYITGRNASLFLLYDENTTNLTFSTIPDVYGSNEVILWVTDLEGNTDFQSLWVNITPVNDPPTIESIDPLIIHYDSSYTYHFFNYVNDFETPKYQLTLTTDEPRYTRVEGLKVIFTYSKSMLGQSGTVIIRVWDEEGASSATVVVVKITSDWVPELVRELPDIILYEGELKTDVFDLDDYFIDPDEDSLYYVTGNSHVNIIIKENHSVDVSAPSDWDGSESVSFIALDPLKARVEDLVQVTVIPVNDPPVIDGVPDLVVRYDEPYIFDLTPYISDPDTHPDDLILSTQTENISFSNLRMIVHFPESYYGYVVPVVIRVSDGIEEDSDTIVITVSDDHPPKALVENLPHVRFYEDTSYTTTWSLHSYFLDADPEDTLYYFNTTGSLDIDIDQALGTIHFTSPENWSGIVSINIRAIDPHGAIAEAPMLVTVIPVNDPPQIDFIPDQEYMKGQSWVLDLRDYVFDIDNDVLNFTDLTVEVHSQYPESITIAGHFIVFDYPSKVRHDEVTITVSDGFNETSQSFLVNLKSKSAGSLWSQLLELWWLILPLVIAIVIALLLIRRALYTDKNVSIEDVFLIDSNGILIKHATERMRPNIDNDMLAGMLTAVQTFITDSFKYSDDTTLLKSLEFGNKSLMIERGKYSYLAIIHTGEFSDTAKEDIREWLTDFEKRYAYALKDWIGDMRPFEGLDEEFDTLFGSKLNKSGVKKLGLHSLSRRFSGFKAQGTAGASESQPMNQEDTSSLVSEDETSHKPSDAAYEEFDGTGPAETTPSHALLRFSLEDDED